MISQMIRTTSRRALGWVSRAGRRSRTLRLECLTAPAEVLFDDADVPYLFAASEADLFALQGYVHASHRLFQMEFMRRMALGRLSEVIGKRRLDLEGAPLLASFSSVDLDAFMRALELERAATLARNQTAPGFVALVDAYVAGVNEHLRRHRRRLPLEFHLLRFAPEQWTPLEPFLLFKAFSFQFCLTWNLKLSLHAMGARWPERAAALRSLILSNARVPDCAVHFDAARSRQLADLGRSILAFTGFAGGPPGSNAWALAGGRTATGQPLLCNDPHLPLFAPSLLYLQHLEAPGIRVAGLSGPGVPGVTAGHSAHHAWGVTHAYVDECDCFIEQIDGDRYTSTSGPRPLRSRREVIAVRRGADETRTLRFTSRGPLISDLLPGHPDLPACSLRWTGHDGGRDLEGYWALARSRSWSEFRRASALVSTPAWNLVYADTAGHVGYCLAGWVPRRPWPGSLDLVDGTRWDDWRGYLLPEELPAVLDPEEGLVASANNPPVDDTFPHYISDHHEPPFRVRRIRSLLAAALGAGVAEMRAIQLDDFSEWGFRFTRERLLPLGESGRPLPAEARQALRVLSSWDGHLRVDYVAPSVFHASFNALVRRLFAARLGEALAAEVLAQLAQQALGLRRLAEQTEEWLSEGDPAAALEPLLVASLVDGIKELRARFGRSSAAWRWGRIHQRTQHHILASKTGPTRLLSIGPTPSPGDWSTVNLGAFTIRSPFAHELGAEARLITDLAEPDRSRWVLATGQAGNPLSPHFRDQAALFAAGEDRPWPFSRAAIQAAARRTLQLRPRR